MSFDANSIAIAAAAADIDHRKKRRNRTTHSCINCHTTKRKCDRKRPCGRCTQLGLTGLCVYEVDDPSTADDPNIDETSKLRKRIAELEGVIRELKNKPHPKWAQAHGPGGDLSFHTRSHNAKRRRTSDEDDDDYDGLEGSAGPSGIKVEPGFNSPAYTLPDSFRMPSDGYNGDSSRGFNCECLTHPAAYQSLSELDSYLRSAINVLSGIRHSESSPISPVTPHARCALLAQISRLQDLIA
ncbi:hypothetical protein BKA62DRAFT_623650 [Auriculariales sp. MPI-PUGE-AT-0066]|nr:hypothetical protein BKA62DRAFT_623650 [Auriculariales sp. MPI-PUGE-AT-0066]